MTIQAKKRDYDLLGESGRAAVETGLAAAEWYHTDIPRKEMKELMQRSDGRALRDTVLWFALFIAFGTGGFFFWPGGLRSRTYNT